MKKVKIPLEASPWASYEIRCPFSLIDAMFEFAPLEYYKNTLNESVIFMFKPKIYQEDSPGQLFIFFAVLHSFLRAGYVINCKSGKYKIKEVPKESKGLYPGSLTREELQNPFIVFKKAFTYKSLEKMNLALFEMVNYALNPFSDYPSWDLITPYIHITKMLDASWEIYQRRVERI